MAHDFILGETGHNWSRGISVLLPKTPDSSSMEEKYDVDHPSYRRMSTTPELEAKIEKEKLQDKLNASAKLYVQAKQGDPRALGAIKDMVTKAKAGDLDARRAVYDLKAGRENLLKKERSEKACLEGSLNDDELAVARDGGPSERASLARIRGNSSIGKSFYPDISTFPLVRARLGYKRVIPIGAKYSVLYQGVRKNWLFLGQGKRPQLIP
jgi:hypothetical protein